jgi:hypothetical protein
MYLFTQSSWRLKILSLGSALLSMNTLVLANEELEWDQDTQIQNSYLSASPALALFNNKLYPAHQGGGKSGQLWYTVTSDGDKWGAR